jgi:hypothetical protein
VLSGPKDVSTGSRLRAKRGAPVLPPIVTRDGYRRDGRSIVLTSGRALDSQPSRNQRLTALRRNFMLSGRKDVSTASRFRAQWNIPVLAFIASAR